MWDHPRIRGEHMCRAMGITEKNGSSPHTRGARDEAHRRIRVGRIIPAYAGSTIPGLQGLLAGQDHPRIRGEHHLHARGGLSCNGSSPHTRGAPVPRLHRDVAERIIPAYAGSTRMNSSKISIPTDHPRIRGEHVTARSASRRSIGSSPHTRGAPVDVGADRGRCRIIPAYAGSTGKCLRQGFRREDHPRIRGEHRSQLSGWANNGGSSPHTRGAPSLSSSMNRLTGIIPAYAGSTSTRFWQFLATRDHPRIRGEH